MYELTESDRKLVEKACTAVEYDDNGDPMKDVLDEDDFRLIVRLLVLICYVEGRM